MSYKRGKFFEEMALGYLEDKGYRIVNKNFKLPLGEIDFIANDKGTLCFIEVKGRTEPYKYEPVEAIDRAKKKRILDTSSVFLKQNNINNKKVRFDVLSIIQYKEAAEFYLIKGAF